nr:unnamed protein product [Digitaria exilis]
METCLPTGDTPALSNGGGEDHISTLDDAVLSNIISRLPLKDVVRTAVLSPRWHHVWASTPLILNDSDLLGDLQNDDDMKWHNIIGDTNDEGTKWHNIIDAVSGALYAHPGPFHLIYLSHVCNYAASQGGGALLCSWLRVLADKGVQNLRLINESLVGYADLPVDILHINSVVTLYLKLWTFPKTNNLSRNRAVFPHLYHLWLCETYIRTIDLDRLLQYSVELRKLTLNGGMDEPIDKINFNFWKEAVPIICVRSRMTKLVFKNCRGGRGEFEFLRFIWERAKVLEKMELVLADEIDLDSVHELLAKLKSLEVMEFVQTNALKVLQKLLSVTSLATDVSSDDSGLEAPAGKSRAQHGRLA